VSPGKPRTGEIYNYIASFGTFLVIVTANPLVAARQARRSGRHTGAPLRDLADRGGSPGMEGLGFGVRRQRTSTDVGGRQLDADPRAYTGRDQSSESRCSHVRWHDPPITNHGRHAGALQAAATCPPPCGRNAKTLVAPRLTRWPPWWSSVLLRPILSPVPGDACRCRRAVAGTRPGGGERNSPSSPAYVSLSRRRDLFEPRVRRWLVDEGLWKPDQPRHVEHALIHLPALARATGSCLHQLVEQRFRIRQPAGAHPRPTRRCRGGADRRPSNRELCSAGSMTASLSHRRSKSHSRTAPGPCSASTSPGWLDTRRA